MKNRINNTAMKVLLLGVAMAISVVMFSKAYFESSYEDFVPQIDRTYRVTPVYVTKGVSDEHYTKLSGGIVGQLAERTPQVEVSTRFTTVDDGGTFAIAGIAFEGSKPTKIREAVAADTLLFDIFPTEVYGDKPRAILANIGSVMISRSLAEKMSEKGDALSMIGQNIECISKNLGVHTVKAVFEDYPANSELAKIDIIAPVDIMGSGKDGVMGNDRYDSFIRVVENANIAEIEQTFEEIKKELILPEVVAWGLNAEEVDMFFNLNELSEFHSNDPQVKVMIYLLVIIASAMLLVAMLNYVLIAVTALVKKARNFATRRCYGAPTWVIYRMVIGEAFFTLLLSLGVAAFIIFALRPQIEDILGIKYDALFGWSSMWIVALTSSIVMLVCGLLPAILYSRIPLSAAFTRYKESKKRWKHALLALQFSGAMLFVSLLMVIALQYRYVLNLDMGYNYENILAVQVNALTTEERTLLKNELSNITEVQNMSYCSSVPLYGGSGNNVQLPEDKNINFNIQDLYSADENYTELLEIEIIQGRNFSKESPVGREILVSDNFITEMEKQVDWGGNPLGKELLFSEHSESQNDRYTICGVFKGFMAGTAYYEDDRAQVLFFNETENDGYVDYLNVLMIKVKDENPEVISIIENVLQRLLPEKMLYVQSYTGEVEAAYNDSRKFRDMVFYAGLIVLIITLIGLIGYMRDEISRRRAEIAIRKIHGATTAEIIRIFLLRVRYLLLFGLVAGGAITYYVSGYLLEMFAKKIALSWWIFALSALIVIVAITATILLTTRKAANANPTENLKSE